ncbi:MAG: keto-deoxy-phosphogluconate aldolase [Asticcacaulis sp. 32-58-5]|nr:MAG: keto-deoxy-phosphogluconate aldolase [Asticcacaulis sp. 32-58-5]
MSKYPGTHADVPKFMTTGPVLPVMVIPSLDQALPLADALMAGGIKVLEITLRTDCALDAIKLIAKERPDAIVGAGTVLTQHDAEKAAKAGAKKGIGGPLPQVKFCPTGGIDVKNAADFLALDNVLCVGGSWVAPAKAMQDGNWAEITRLSAEAVATFSRA